MSKVTYNDYNMRQVGDRIRLPGCSVSVTEKLRDDKTTVRWAQLSKFNKKTDSYENFSIFKDDLEMLSMKMPEILALLRGGASNDEHGKAES